MPSDDLVKENHRLSQLVRKMQDAISTLRDEITDANAELVASRKLFDEQKQILLQELDRERAKRTRVERVLERSQKKDLVSCGTNTVSTSDAAVATQSCGQSEEENDARVLSVAPPNRTEFEAFCDWLSFTAKVRDVDFQELFRGIGLRTVEEVCANVTEYDLVEFGVSPQKAKVVMHCIMECTIQFLS